MAMRRRVGMRRTRLIGGSITEERPEASRWKAEVGGGLAGNGELRRATYLISMFQPGSLGTAVSAILALPVLI